MLLAQSAGWKTSGVELSKSVAQFARDERLLDVFTGTVEQAAYPERYFDAVTLWDVIEHLDDPVSTLAEIHRIMAPGGILVVFTINQESLLTTIGQVLYKLSLNRWKHLMELFYDIIIISSFPAHITPLKRSEFEVADAQFGPANVHRWRIVPISPVMIFGSDVIDFLSGLVKRKYRMLVYARKAAKV
jgi:SAM-dependent methyltransferase